MAIRPGANLGPYQIIEQIGRGGMATVYKAFQPALERYVAIKVLPEFFAAEPGFRERFHREAVAVARLHHPNILTIFDHSQQGDSAYIVNEYVEGGTLQERTGKPLGVDEVVGILGPVADALDYAHQRGILHRDVKPSNILIGDGGRPLLGDFGLARMLDSKSRLTTTGSMVGTPEYMAPEECAGLGTGPSGDQYSLGVVAYQLLTGRVPFEAETPAAVLVAQMNSPLPLPTTINPDLKAATERVLLKALARDPTARYPGCRAFIDALASSDKAPAEPVAGPDSGPGASTRAGVAAPPIVEPVRPVGAGPSRRPGRNVILLGAGVIVLLVAGTVVAVGKAGTQGGAARRSGPASAAATTAVRGSPAATPSATVAAPPQQIEPAMPQPRQESAAAAVGNTLYVIAGKDSSGGSTDSVFAFDGSAWRAGPALPIPLDHPSAAVLQSFVYVSGGFSSGPPSGRVFRLNANRWEEVAAMKRPRGAHALVVVGAVAYALGGADAIGDVSVPEAYDPLTNRWRDLPPLPAPRNHVSGFAFQGMACIAGGRTPDVPRVDCYDPIANTWKGLPNLPQATSGAGAGALGDQVVVAGGEDPQAQVLINQVARLRNGAWTSEAMLIPRHGLALASYRGRLWACGGGSQSLVHPAPDCTSIG